MPIKAVLDTNILVSGLANQSGAPAKVIDRWLEGQFVVLSSKPALMNIREYYSIILKYREIPQLLCSTD